ncbi:single-stranded DNA-binding protein [Xylophilus ampelinus]|uniref:Single-stranded DNA-binding protein n=1 Tax=Xylophilus ampelinus TaxID=54067 RepID=A0A318SQL4_9BURK|nr:single-stranded DNA-binding protein [Xylophilus ampelinus]MCS4508780.1 single-stranded DNA-binding protein [Xylophilus ampelinus]PYE79350.1 hypothetical protein DFQ15_10281 [Xylophilus ampelinus]
MSELASIPKTGNTIAPMEVVVRGKIDAVRRHEQKRYTRILTPAPDAYSRPQTVEIRSNQQLGQKGDEITVKATLGGYTRKPFKSTDRETGEVSSITPVDMTLDAVE